MDPPDPIQLNQIPPGSTRSLLDPPDPSWLHQISHGCSRSLLAPPDPSWLHQIPPGLSRSLLAPPDPSWIHQIPSNFTRSHPTSPDPSWLHQIPPGSTRPRSCPRPRGRSAGTGFPRIPGLSVRPSRIPGPEDAGIPPPGTPRDPGSPECPLLGGRWHPETPGMDFPRGRHRFRWDFDDSRPVPGAAASPRPSPQDPKCLGTSGDTEGTLSAGGGPVANGPVVVVTPQRCPGGHLGCGHPTAMSPWSPHSDVLVVIWAVVTPQRCPCGQPSPGRPTMMSPWSSGPWPPHSNAPVVFWAVVPPQRCPPVTPAVATPQRCPRGHLGRGHPTAMSLWSAQPWSPHNDVPVVIWAVVTAQRCPHGRGHPTAMSPPVLAVAVTSPDDSGLGGTMGTPSPPTQWSRPWWPSGDIPR
ncbi:PREDICTED: vegetative cell wall protein gp1-like [Corvus brachyrhynchos]|uniref:vegetative cell wall protein gp1-like n=1 Tax=Corvus brachyrhynchos TaxID=85066 RepID=UPI0008163713|nr:PREDICTED: vegetative cell wall protein gp1-like [Corvus brachyrhynchos]